MSFDIVFEIDLKNKIKKLYKRLGIDTKSMSQSEINRRVLAFAKHTNHPLKIYLTKKQKNNANFLIALYKLQPELTNARYPGERLFNNVEFMLEYYKIRYNAKILWDNIYMFTHFNAEIMTNPEFVTKLALEFPNENVLKIAKYAQIYAKKYSFASNLDNQFKALPYRLPIETLMAQAKTFGCSFVELLPRSHPQYNLLVKCAAKLDGEKSLKYLKNEKLKENKSINKNNYKNHNKNNELTK